MVDTNGIGFGSRIMDAREAFPLSTRLWLARLFETNTSINYDNKTYIKNILQAL